jgi:DNA-binding Xre family transcriptional regulator
MEIGNNVRLLMYKKGYKNLLQLAEGEKVSYYLLRKLANNESNSLDKQFLIDLCTKLDCEIGDLLHLKK